jgi:two-component system, sensor histidine kinase LadS
MFRYFLHIFLYAIAFGLSAIDTLRINGVEQTPISRPFLRYKSANLINEKWQIINNDNTILKPLQYFDGEASFQTQLTTPLVFEWPDNKIEQIYAVVTNAKGDTVAEAMYHDQNGFQNQLFIKNKVLILYNPQPQETYTLHYRLFAHNPVYVICWARNIDALFNRFIKEYSWYGIFSGMILIVFALNLLLFLLLRNHTFIWYGLYTLSLGLFHWSYIGVGFQWIWPHLTLWNRYGYIFSSFLMLSFQFVYFRFYIQNLFTLHKWYIHGIILVRMVILLASIFNTSVIEWYFLIDFCTFSYLLFLALKIKLYHSLHGKMFVASISLLLMSYLVFILAYYHMINSSFWAYNSIAFGGTAELLIGLLALALRFKFLSDEKNKLQHSEIVALTEISTLKDQLITEIEEKERIQVDINKQLEAKIQERTLEIAQKNEKLEDLNKKLLEMSSQLDKQNYSLHKTLATDRLKLMWGKNINFVDFQKTFDSDQKIYRFIAELKWQNDTFKCKKCASETCQEGSQFLSKKCTVCRYEESVTANTLFHGIKFPIVKALYISLYTVNYRDTLAIKDLAEEIDLRDATVWAFRKKTLDKLEKINTNKGDVLRNLIVD